jgi:hypothetical protein
MLGLRTACCRALLAALLSVTMAIDAAPAQGAPQPGEGLLVDLADIDLAGLEALKSLPAVSWWVELGATLLLVGEMEALRAQVPSARLLEGVGRVHPDGLALHARGCNQEAQGDARALILPGEVHDLVRVPLAFSPLAPTAKRDDPGVGAPALEPVAPNSVIGRLRHLDRRQAGWGKRATDPRIEAAVAAVDPERWFAAVSDLAAFDRSSFSPEKRAARQWLAQQFAALGLEVSEPQFAFPWPTPHPLANVVGFWQGARFPEDWIVVGGHYDSRNENNGPGGARLTPGADDNASGCAGVLEAARAILPFRPQRSILFMCYGGEEQGLYGSAAHVFQLSQSGRLGRIRAMLNMDMIGWSPDETLGVVFSTRSDIGAMTANLALANLLADAALDYVPALSPNRVVVTNVSCCSDHMPYLNAGVPAAFSIHWGTTDYPHYHRTSDTPANLGPHARAIGSAIVRANVAALAQLAGIERFEVEPGISGLWYHPGRDGEGFSIEILEDDAAVVTWYTYDNDGSQMWLIGVGTVEGHRLRFDTLVRPLGARFGDAFDPDRVQRLPWGSLAIEFDDCQTGRFAYRGPEGYDDLDQPLVRLGQMSGTGCGSPPGAEGSALSGLFYDPARDGEGFSIQVVDAGPSATVPVGLWFTHTPEGEQAWMIGIGAIEDGTRFVATDVRQPIGARFGDAFDADAVDRLPWGSWALDFSGCDAAALTYAAAEPAYGDGAGSLVRLSRPLGVDCPSP